MPLSDPLADERFDDLVAALCAAPAPVPATLSERVETMLAATPAPRASRRPRRRLVLPLLAATTVAAAGVLVASRVDSRPARVQAKSAAATSAATATASAAAAEATVVEASSAASSAAPTAREPDVGAPVPVELVVDDGSRANGGDPTEAPVRTSGGKTSADLDKLVPATPGRLQHMNADLSVRVKDPDAVAKATSEATRAIQTYGGYIVTSTFDTPRRARATSRIVAKVPIDRMQEAIAGFTAAGILRSQHVDLSDLQRQADGLDLRISRLALRIARLDARLASGQLSETDRATLKVLRAQAATRLAETRQALRSTRREAALADLSLEFVAEPAPATTNKARSVKRHGAGAAIHTLGRIVRGAVYPAVLVSPLAALAGLFWFGARWQRRRRERLLLESA